jgi:hypothetical protein
MLQGVKCRLGKHEIEKIDDTWSYCIYCGNMYVKVKKYIFYHGKLKKEHKHGERYYWDY